MAADQFWLVASFLQLIQVLAAGLLSFFHRLRIQNLNFPGQTHHFEELDALSYCPDSISPNPRVTGIHIQRVSMGHFQNFLDTFHHFLRLRYPKYKFLPIRFL